jgi:hypothetical protein
MFEPFCLIRRQGGPTALAGCPQHRLCHPVGHAHAGKPVKSAAAVRAARIDYRQGRRQLRSHRMVIGDDHIKPPRRGQGHFRHAANAAVHRDQQAGLFSDPRHCVRIQAVSFVHTIGNIGADPAAGGLQRVDQQRGRGHAVGIEVAVDADNLTPLQCLQNAGHGRSHIRQAIRILDHGIAGLEKPVDLFSRSQSPVIENLKEKRVFAEVGEDVGGKSGVDPPILGLHDLSHAG